MNIAFANALGVAALVCWSMNVTVTRHIGEAHPFGMPGVSFVLAGTLLVFLDLIRGKPLPWKGDASPKFLPYCGGAFVAYVILYTSGLAFSESRFAVLPLGLVNYFWPSLILVLMPFFFECAVKWRILVAGMALCVAGVASSLLWGMPAGDMLAVFREIWPAFLMMAAAAFLWAFYSNAVRKWGGTANGIGWFQLAGGVCFLILWRIKGGPLGLETSMLVPLLLHSLVVNAAAYMFWDCGVRRGDIGLMGVLANFLPIGSVLFGAWYLNDPATPGLWMGGALVTAGAILCRRGLH